MNKVVIVLIAALASYTCAEIFIPKNLGCTRSAKLNANSSGRVADGHLWAKDFGDAHFMRIDLMHEGQLVSSQIIRCDKKDKDGNCFNHVTASASCIDSYTSNVNSFSNPFEYDSQETIPCPIGEGECTMYCLNATVCYIVNSDKVVVAHKIADAMSMIMDWQKDEYFTMDKFVFTTCDGNELPYPVNPCSDYSSGASSQSSSSVPPTPKPSSSNSSVVKASFIVVLAALLITLF